MKNGLSWVVSSVLVILGLAAVSIFAYAAPNQNLHVSFINVGQGDSALYTRLKWLRHTHRWRKDIRRTNGCGLSA